MKQPHFDRSELWQVEFDQIRTHIPDSTRMIDLDAWLRSLNCELNWDCHEKKLRVVPMKEVKNAKSHGCIRFGGA